jgi:ABC-type multidrug transport system ATPase subunit
VKYRLVHLTGSLAGQIRDLDADQIVLGRDPEAAQVVFNAGDRSVSRRHAALVVEDGALILRDLDSSTGTFVDGESIEEAELRDGDVFELGSGGPRLRVQMKDDGGTLVVPAATLSALTAAITSRRSEAPLAPGSRLRITFVTGDSPGRFLDLAGAVVRIGRAAGNTVCLPDDRSVSAQHAKIVTLESRYVLIDLESTNGTFLNGQRIERSPLGDGDLVMLGSSGPQLRVQILPPLRGARPASATVEIPNFAELAARSSGGVLVGEVPLGSASFTFGRLQDADVLLESPIVSKSHARLACSATGFELEDLGSANGTYVGGRRIERCALAPGESFVIGPFQIELRADSLAILDTRNRVRLDARGLAVSAGGQSILTDVSLSLPPGSFTALIGPSGAGKSTLLTGLAGARPAARGQVLLNGEDLYRAFDRLKASIGYVPQDDIVHRELSVAQSLAYTARLRLPAETPPDERARRVTEVLATLEMSERRDVEIRRLSGGQRKRVSIAAELLTEPNVLFLDEPTSGLDPGLEEALMLLLRELAYKGKTVVLVTHTLDNIHLCDGLVLLVSGRLAFYGSPDEARSHFGIGQMANLYARLKEKAPEQWQAAFRSTSVHRERITAPLAATRPAPALRRSRPAPGALRQLVVLTERYADTLARDARNALLLVAQAPLIAALIGLSLLYGTSDIAYTKPKNTLLFLLALTAVWFGCSNAARELVKERAIYLRERMVTLRILPYVLSKLLVLSGLAAVQCVLFFVILDRWFGIPGNPLLLLGAMLLASVVGILLGLAVSALVTSADRAMTLLPIILIPQVLFTSPSVQLDMHGPAGLVARAMPTWWSYDLLRRVALAPGDAVDDDGVEGQLKQGGPVLMTKERFERMLQDGYEMFRYRSAIEITWAASLPESLGEHLPARLGRWRAGAADALVLAGFGLALLAGTAVLLRRHDLRR